MFAISVRDVTLRTRHGMAEDDLQRLTEAYGELGESSGRIPPTGRSH
jgi:hypothetical protein